MNHLKHLIFCNLLFIALTSQVSLPYKIAGFDVDSFLKKVLTSQNFDEIANKIAEKAAEKIKNLKDFKSVDSKKSPTYRVSDISSNNQNITIVHTKEDNFKRNELRKQPLKKLSTEKATVHTKEQIVTANDGLILRFKHFTKQNKYQGHKDSIVKDVVPLQNETEKIQGSKIQLQENVSVSKLQSNNMHVNVSNVKQDVYEYISYESENETTDKEIENQEIADQQNVTNEILNDEKNEHETTPDTEPDSLNAEFEKNYKAFVEYQKTQNEEKSLNIKPVEDKESPNLDDEDTVSNQSKNSVEEELNESAVKNETNELEQDNTTKTLFRQEGNKIFTYEKSPDYKEYHEKLSFAQKTTGIL